MLAIQQGFCQKVCTKYINALYTYSYTGWSNPPKILSVTFQNSNITLRWGPPDYTGGETVQYYRIGFQNFYQRYAAYSYQL